MKRKLSTAEAKAIQPEDANWQEIVGLNEEFEVQALTGPFEFYQEATGELFVRLEETFAQALERREVFINDTVFQDFMASPAGRQWVDPTPYMEET